MKDKRRMVTVVYGINGFYFDEVLKYLKDNYPRRKYEAYGLCGDNRYCIKYNLSNVEVASVYSYLLRRGFSEYFLVTLSDTVLDSKNNQEE